MTNQAKSTTSITPTTQTNNADRHSQTEDSRYKLHTTTLDTQQTSTLTQTPIQNQTYTPPRITMKHNTHHQHLYTPQKKCSSHHGLTQNK